MSLSEYFEQHEEQAFVAKALATAIAIILIKNYLSWLISFLFLIFPVVFLIGIRMHAAALGVDAMQLLREHITFFPMMRSEADRRTEVKPWVTYGLIFVNFLVFYGFELNAPEDLITDNLVFLPHKPDFFNVPLSAFTSMFLHAGNGHLWGNMTFLWVVGTAVERRVGRQKFLGLYLLTGLIAGLTYILVEFLFHDRAGHVLGASGAIAGIMGIFAVRCYFKSMIFPLPILGIFSLILPISLKIKLNSLVIMALFFLSDLSGGIDQIAGESGSMVAHWAHLGGMISGMIVAGYLKLGGDAIEERHLEEGIKASEARVGFEGGERSLQIALDHNPDNIDALLGMARLKTKFKNVPEGKELYEKAIRLMMTARPAEVVEVFREYVRKYLGVPPDPGIVFRLAEILRKAGEIELCIHCLERLVEMADVPPQVREKGLFQLATLLEFTSRFEAAGSCFARFAAEYPASLMADKAREKAGDHVYVPARQGQPVEAPAGFCPTCGTGMTKRASTEGPNKGKLFLVCGAYPDCRTYLPVQELAEMMEFPPPLPQSAPESYSIVFNGSISLSADPEETKENLARLFRCGRERIDTLFQGKRVVLKKGLDHAEAVKMQEAFNRTGAVCTLETEKPAVTPAQPSPQPMPAVKSAAPPPVVPVADSFVCPSCGQVQEKGEMCVKCGVYFAKLAVKAERDFHSFHDHLPGGKANPVMSEAQERRWAMCCHLMVFSGVVIPFGNLLGPLAIWLWKRKDSEFVDFHGKTAVNYQITLFLAVIGGGIVAVFTGTTMAYLLFPLLGLYSLVMIIVAAIKSNRGDYVEFAICGNFIK